MRVLGFIVLVVFCALVNSFLVHGADVTNAGLHLSSMRFSSRIELPELPFPADGLAPYISEKTLGFHHGKHHQRYVTTTKQLIEGSVFADSDLEAIIRATHNNPTLQGLFNNAAQSWNHAFYWKCMKPNGGGLPKEDMKVSKLINESFGSFAEFRTQFTNAANTVFGSGWAWVVYNPSTSKLEVVKSSGAENPMVKDVVPILVVDVWEHAYYLDFQNLRPNYVDAFLDHLVNWDFVEEQLNSA